LLIFSVTSYVYIDFPFLKQIYINFLNYVHVGKKGESRTVS
jgi:hypothetical protein